MKFTQRTATEASAVTALAVGVSFVVSGAYVPGIAAFVLGVALLGVYELFGIENISLSEDQVEEIGNEADEALDEYTKE